MTRLSILTPFLFAVYPVLFLYSTNMYITPTNVIWMPILVIGIAAFLLIAIINIYFKDKIKASLFVSAFLLVFFMFGDIYIVLLRVVRFPQVWLALLFSILLVLYFMNLKKLKDKHSLHTRSVLFFVTGCLLILISLYNMVSFHISNNMSLAESGNLYSEQNSYNTTHPDIFYIIVDGYGRQDILYDLYDYDNSQFLTSLEQRGFYIASKSMSNYCQTTLSLASSLNMNYIDSMISDLDRQSYDMRLLMESIMNSRVRNILEREDYYLTSFFTPYSPVDINNVDNHQKRMFSLNEFSHFLINKTPLPLTFRDFQYELYRRDILHVLENGFESLDQRKPNFVYAHIIPPHPPFVFDSTGEFIEINRYFALADGSHWGANKRKYIEGYISQVEFINASLLEMVDKILGKSENPIIIIQSDHGPGSELDWNEVLHTNFEERLSILNVYYFYDHDYERLYDEISPVNTFRVIFNQYFGADFEMLEDESYFSTRRYPYEYFTVR